MKTPTFVISAIFAAMSLSCTAIAQKRSAPAGVAGMPTACPAMDDVVGMLKMADRESVILSLREHAKTTGDTTCEAKIKTVEGGLSTMLLAVTSQQQAKVCSAYAQSDVKSALSTVFLVSFLYKSKPCDAFN